MPLRSVFMTVSDEWGVDMSRERHWAARPKQQPLTALSGLVPTPVAVLGLQPRPAAIQALLTDTDKAAGIRHCCRSLGTVTGPRPSRLCRLTQTRPVG